MGRRWNWDFEDERGRIPSTRLLRPRDSLTALSPERVMQIRRRRLGAGVLALVLLGVSIAAIAGSGGQSSARSAARANPAAAARVRSHQASEPENDQNAAVSSTLAYTPFVREGSTRTREIALTFDDGPGPYTPGVLSVLEHYHVHATFFVIGRMLRYFGNSVVREIEDGDVIGDHTENHPMLAHISAHDQREELAEQIARVELLGAKRPVLFRPPYGSFNATTWRELKALHLLMVLWSADTGDYAQPGVEAIVQRALAGAHPGAIILMHDAGGTRSETIAALPAIITGLRSRGYTLVTVPRLLMDNPPPAGAPLPSSLAGD
jgi:peptidoglycan/xylan/chitin deacetylase (PgdA/CDA1 family)